MKYYTPSQKGSGSNNALKGAKGVLSMKRSQNMKKKLESDWYCIGYAFRRFICFLAYILCYVTIRTPRNTWCSSDSPINKNLFFIYFSESPLPVVIRDNIQWMSSRNQSWNVKVFDEPEAIRYLRQKSWVLCKLFQKINPCYAAARADFLRYVILYYEGGIYLDVKCRLDIQLDELVLEDRLMATHWPRHAGSIHNGWGLHPEISNPKGEFINSVIISPRGNFILKHVLLSVCLNIILYNRCFYDVGKKGVLRTTGPLIYSMILERYSVRKIREFSFDELSFTYSIFDGLEHKKIFKKHYSELNEPIVL